MDFNISSDPSSSLKSLFISLLKSRSHSSDIDDLITLMKKPDLTASEKKELNVLLNLYAEDDKLKIFIPYLRSEYDLLIDTHQKCLNVLSEFKSYISKDDHSIIDSIINFLEYDQEGTLSFTELPQVKLLSLIDQIPSLERTKLFDCTDYISSLLEDDKS